MWGKEQGVTPHITLSFELEGVASADDLSVTLNRKTVGDGALASKWVDYDVIPETVQKGANQIEMTLRASAESGARLLDAQLRISYKAGR